MSPEQQQLENLQELQEQQQQGQQEDQQEQQGCQNCTNISYCIKWWHAYGVQICSKCKLAEKLISKSQAKQKYLLSDSELSQLGAICKENPRHKDWNQMKLLLESQVRKVCYDKYGGEIGLETHRRTQNLAKAQRLRDREKAKRKRENEEATRIDNKRKQIEEDNDQLLQSTKNSLINRGDAEE
eukprot:TRINITY_DN2612_c0_g1_i1.p2 TRINITY_DN2612_c0_g1~~TRINITY_DN2612_c0_g1_i1.p2  ORF type:complete len:207 (-),score=19.79 TRINITY_DN2612_c0_g1_i1:200-751(-)